jgi:hypothetical protein
MNDVARSIVVEFVVALIMGGAGWLLAQYRKVLLARSPRFAALPLASVAVLAVAFEVALPFLVQRGTVTWPMTIVLAATPIVVLILTALVQLRPLWVIGVRGGDVRIDQGLDYGHSLELCQNYIDFLGTGANKLTSQPTFGDVVARCRADRPLRFLLSSPDTINLEDAARRYGRDRDEYKRLVTESLRRLALLRDDRRVNLEVRFYDHPPVLRLMFIDDSMCLASPNVYGEGDGSQLPQLHLVRPPTQKASASLYYALEMYFNYLWDRHSKRWDFKEYL